MLLLLVAALVFGTAPCMAQEATGPLDLILIVDTSKTMRGAGNAANIFPEVLATCRNFVSELKVGDTVTLIPFASTAPVEPTVTITSDTERERLYSKIHSLEADGDWTYTAEALDEGLREAARLEAQFPTHNQLVLIMTDGLNDPPPGARAQAPSLQSVSRPYAGKPWYVYQIQLGPNVDPDLQEAIGVFPNGKTIHDRGGQNLAKLRQTVEEHIKPKQEEPAEPREVTLTLGVDGIELTLEERGTKVEAARDLSLPDGVPAAGLRLEMRDRGTIPASVEVTADIAADAGGEPRIRVSATAREDLPNGSHRGRLRVSLDPTVAGVAAVPVEIPLEIKARMQPPVWPRILIGVVAALVLLTGILAVWNWIRNRKMAGQLEYWPEGKQRERRKIPDLSELGAGATIGSDAIPLPPDVGELGTLSTRKVDGQKHVVVMPASGKTLTMNKTRATELVLYDRDVFSLEGWEFHYRGAVGTRPR